MEMGKEEICREYRTAKNRKKQIAILAEMNCCSVDRITGILKEGGAYKDPAPPARKEAQEEKWASLPDAVCNALYAELGRLDGEIRKLEKSIAEKQGQYKDSADLRGNLSSKEFNRVTYALNKLATYEELEDAGRLIKLV